MAKSELGTKRIDPETGRKFYDLNKDPIVSPYTGEVLQLDTGKRTMLSADRADGAPRRDQTENAEDVDLLDDDVEVELDDDDVLDDDEDDNVSLDEITDVPGDDDE